MMSSAVGWLADCAREFNVYLSCQLHVKLIGTPSTPHARRLGSVLGAKQIFPALAYVERENPSGGIFASTVAREISLEEKRVHVPTLMIQEPFFSIPVAAAPTVQDTVVTTHVVISPVATMNEDEEPVVQDPIEPVVAHEEEQQ